MKFVARTTAPSATNKYYIKAGKGGYNRAMEINTKTHSCLPNCVAMAHGRWLESQKQTNYSKYDKLPTGNAENYYPYTKDGYKRGKTPKLGAIICWRKGKAGVASDGAGHVAFVEKVYDNGDVLPSNRLQVLIDRVGPDIKTSFVKNKDKITFEVDAKDDLSGVKTISYSLDGNTYK